MIPGSTSARKIVKQPEPEAAEEVFEVEEAEEPLVESEPLIGDMDVPPPKSNLPIDADESLISEDSLHSDEDPLAILREKRKQEMKLKTAAMVAGKAKSSQKAKAVEPEIPKELLSLETEAKTKAAAKPSAKISKPALPKVKAADTTGEIAAVEAEPAEAQAVEAVEAEEAAEVVEAVDAEAAEAVEAVEEAAPEAPPAKSAKTSARTPAEKPAAKPSVKSVPPAGKAISTKTVAGSTRLKVAPATSSKRGKAEPAEAPQEKSNSKRTTRRSVRSAGPRPLPRLYKILGGIFVVLVLVVGLGFKPFMRWMHLKDLDDPASTPEVRKDAALSLYNEYKADAFPIFSPRLDSPEAGIRDAAAAGLELVARTRNPVASVKAVERLGEVFEKTDGAGKLVFAAVLGRIAEPILNAPKPDGKSGEEQAAADAACMTGIAKTLIAATDPKLDAEVRATAIDSLMKIKQPGVCTQLLRVAAAEKGELRSKARRGIQATALPDSVGELLQTMRGEDKELAKDAETAFVTVRDSAKSDDLIPLLDDKSVEVRTKIVEALSTRKMETAASKGITKALNDTAPEIRALAVAAIPTTGISGPVDQLLKLVTDDSEAVRVANADTLGKLRDPPSFAVLLQAFKNELQGKTMEAYVLALGKRCYGKEKDLNAIGIVMPLFDSHAASEDSLRKAMVLLTRVDQGAKREAERGGWSKDRWKKWWANIHARDKLAQDAYKLLQDADEQKQGSKKLYPKLLEMTVSGLDKLEKCRDMCAPDDPEDAPFFEKKMQKYTVNRELFFKHQELDMSSGH